MTSDPERVDSATFEPQRLRQGRSLASVVTGAWIVGLIGLVGIGGLGHLLGGSTAPVVPSATPPAAQRVGAAAPDPIIRLTSPAVGPIVISRPQLTVAGGIATHLDHVVIAFEGAQNQLVADATVDVSDPNGGVRPLVAPTFNATFTLPSPRPSGTMWVVVTAYDNIGVAVDVVRRAVVIGVLSTPEPADPRPH